MTTRVLLLSTYELGHAPHAVAMAAAFLERAGFAPRALDLAVENLDAEAVRDADLVLFSVPMHTALRLALVAIARVRALAPTARIGCFGLYAPLHEALLRRSGVDLVAGGECEETLVAWARGATDARAVVELRRLDFPVPSRRALPPLRKYAHLQLAPDEHRVAGYTEASRGCKHGCRHCPIPAVYGRRFFVVPVETVVADVKAQVESGARHVTLGDADFLNGPKHAVSVLRALHQQFPELTFDATIKIEHVLQHRELFNEFAQCGLLFVVSAVESLSDTVLAILDKGHTAADVDAALAVLRAAGIALRPSLLPFTPWSTLADYGALLDWIERQGLDENVDPVHLSIRLLVPPGSLLLDRPEMAPFIDALDEKRLTYAWRHPDPRMDALQREVAALVENAVRERAPNRVTLARIRDAWARAAGVESRPAPSRRPPMPVPRLTESWFC